MPVKDRKLPVIQKTQDGELVNIDGQTYKHMISGCFIRIDKYDFDRELGDRKLITWDAQFGT